LQNQIKNQIGTIADSFSYKSIAATQFEVYQKILNQ